MEREKSKPAAQIRASANLRGKTVRIEVYSRPGAAVMVWLDREEVATFIPELKAAYEAILKDQP